MSILHDVRAVLHSTGAAAGITTVEPSVGVDTRGFCSVAFLAAMGAVTAEEPAEIYAEMSSDNGDQDAWESIKGSAVTVPDDGDDKLYVLDISHPAKRYVRCCVSRSGETGAALIGIVALLYDPRQKPVGLHADTASLKTVAEGIAGVA